MRQDIVYKFARMLAQEWYSYLNIKPIQIIVRNITFQIIKRSLTKHE